MSSRENPSGAVGITWWSGYTGYGCRQTIAIKQIEHMISRRGAQRSREILEVLANAERGPLTAPQIKAVEMLLSDPEHADKITEEYLIDAIVELLTTAEEEAKLLAVTHKIPFWRALAITWFRKCKKRRPPAQRAA
ncbi:MULTISPECIES: hypothetical protein [unclassified Rhizobium]|uniref:hypothetical protein n=1 Tax=unclassified Rhizobium TaxID=2613769 RepID=UPI0037F58570